MKYIGTTLYKYISIYVCIFNLQGETPLYVAVFNADTQIVELLIEKGADPDNRDDDVSTKYIWS
jgi:ankyrin repeat protein